MSRRNNNCGTLIKKPSGLYLAKWMYHGQTFVKSTGTKKESEARKVLEKLVKPFLEDTEIEVISNVKARLEAKKHLRDESRRPKDIPIDEIFVTLLSRLETQDWSPKTKRNVEGVLRVSMRWFKEHYAVKTMLQINRLMVEQYLIWATKHYTAGGYNSIGKRLKLIWKILSEDGKYFENVFDMYKMRNEGASHRKALSKEEIVKLLEACKDDEQRLVILVGVYCGMRLGDAARLKWSQIDFDRKVINHIPAKTKKHIKEPIPIPIHNVLMSGLMQAKRWRKPDDEYVMPMIAHEYQTTSLNRVIQKIFIRAGIQTSEYDDNGYKRAITGFHSLRRTFVGIMIDSGMNPFLVQKLVGHTGIEMTQYYYNINQNLLRQGINRAPVFQTSDTIDVTPNSPVKISDKIDYNEGRKFDKELEDLIDTFFDENGNPIRQIDDVGIKKLNDRGLISGD